MCVYWVEDVMMVTVQWLICTVRKLVEWATYF
jgi:hypothetical protein